MMQINIDIVSDINYIIEALEELENKYGNNESIKYKVDDFKFNLALLTIKYATQIVPVDTGYLKSTVYFRNNGGLYIVGYKAPYSAYVHESLENKHKEGKYAKFLEIGFNMALSEISRAIGKSLYYEYDLVMTDGRVHIEF